MWTCACKSGRWSPYCKENPWLSPWAGRLCGPHHEPSPTWRVLERTQSEPAPSPSESAPSAAPRKPSPLQPAESAPPPAISEPPRPYSSSPAAASSLWIAAGPAMEGRDEYRMIVGIGMKKKTAFLDDNFLPFKKEECGVVWCGGGRLDWMKIGKLENELGWYIYAYILYTIVHI